MNGIPAIGVNIHTPGTEAFEDAEIDRFIYDHDTALYRDNTQNMTENVSEIAEALKQRDTHDMALWIAEIAADGTDPEERRRALELLRKLAEYRPLAKIEEIEEQNYNMVDNVLNNGAGEKALVSGQGKDHEAQENNKNNQREM